MVIVRLQGGLGNQMFQYACGRRVAYAARAELKLDLTDLEGPTRRSYALGAFAVQAERASQEDIRHFRRSGVPRRALSALTGGRIARMWETHVVRQKHFHFEPLKVTPGDEVYLDGYWQSERYFEDVTDLIRSDFTIIDSPPAGVSHWIEEIRSTASVSVHVRRGDYVQDPLVSRVHGALPLDYYRRAGSMVRDRVGDPHFFIFTDEPQGVATDICGPGPSSIVQYEGGNRTIEDLRLMSLCQHHIIANSTFSWWGAWLNGGPGKIVVAPTRWFADYAADTKDLVPASWERI